MRSGVFTWIAVALTCGVLLYSPLMHVLESQVRKNARMRFLRANAEGLTHECKQVFRFPADIYTLEDFESEFEYGAFMYDVIGVRLENREIVVVAWRDDEESEDLLLFRTKQSNEQRESSQLSFTWKKLFGVEPEIFVLLEIVDETGREVPSPWGSDITRRGYSEIGSQPPEC
jgi:hypothetical protein